jgi:sporulation protein YlmC with PRC-barrel domain
MNRSDNNDSNHKGRTRNLQELSGSSFEIADGQPDIRGWNVKDFNGRKIGEVDELIFDENSRRVRYMVVDLDGNDLDLGDREVLVPIGFVQLHEKDDDVILPLVSRNQLMALPDYEEDGITPELEQRVRTIFTGSGQESDTTVNTGSRRDEQFYEHEHFDDRKLYRKRDADRASNTANSDDRYDDADARYLRSRTNETDYNNRDNLNRNELGQDAVEWKKRNRDQDRL